MARPWLTYPACEDLVQAERNDLTADRAQSFLDTLVAGDDADNHHLDFSDGELALLAGGANV